MILFKSCYIRVTKFQFSTFFDKEFLKQTDPITKSDPPENNFEISRSTGKSGRHKLAATSKVASAQMTLKWGRVSGEHLQLVCNLSMRRVSAKRRSGKQTGETVKARKLLGLMDKRSWCAAEQGLESRYTISLFRFLKGTGKLLKSV